jgi:hypothetical protein
MTEQWFEQALFGEGPIELRPAETWTDDLWFLDQDKHSVRFIQPHLFGDKSPDCGAPS